MVLFRRLEHKGLAQSFSTLVQKRLKTQIYRLMKKRCLRARVFHDPFWPLINTAALARCVEPLTTLELFQQFVRNREKPLKRLTFRSDSVHRAKAPVLIRNCGRSREMIVRACAWLLICAWAAAPAVAQVVAVTMQLDNPSIGLGGVTTLHVYAQVVPAQRPTSERIFSWYVDLLNPTPGIAAADYSQLQKPTSDNNAQTSSTGTTQSGNRLGIYDTFINDSPVSKSGTGVNTPVELSTSRSRESRPDKRLSASGPAPA